MPKKEKFQCRVNCDLQFGDNKCRTRHENKKCSIYGGEVDKRNKVEFELACERSREIDGRLINTSQIYKEIMKNKYKSMIDNEILTKLNNERIAAECKLLQKENEELKRMNERLLAFQLNTLTLAGNKDATYVYIFQTTEWMKTDPKVFKIGWSADFLSRKRGYAKGTVALTIYRSINGEELETNILEILRNTPGIIPATEYGREMFRGELTDIATIVHTEWYKMNVIERAESEEESGNESEEDEDEDESESESEKE